MTPAVLLAMRDIADVDQELATRVLSYRWLATDVLSDDQRLAIEAMRDIVGADLELGQQAVALPWLKDELSGIESDTLNALREAVLIDLDFAKLVVSLPWLTDDLIHIERDALSTLHELARADPDLAKRVVDLPLLTDDLTTDEVRALRALQGISSSDLELARRVANFSWFADGVTVLELRALTEMPKYVLRTWDFTDSDGDGMIDAAEIKYGFDPNDAASFPEEPEVFLAERHPIRGSEIGAHYELGLDSIDIRWIDPEDGSFILSLRTLDSPEWNIYNGGHYPGTAPVKFGLLNLSGTETLVGRFSKYAPDRSFVEDHSRVHHRPGLIGDARSFRHRQSVQQAELHVLEQLSGAGRGPIQGVPLARVPNNV